MKREIKNQRRILIIDDNEHLVSAISDYLKVKGLQDVIVNIWTVPGSGLALWPDTYSVSRSTFL